MVLGGSDAISFPFYCILMNLWDTQIWNSHALYRFGKDEWAGQSPSRSRVGHGIFSLP